MKKTILIFAAIILALTGLAQHKPDNVDIGIFANGSNGSNGGSAAHLEFALRITPVTGTSYSAAIPAEDFIVFLRLPIADFAAGDLVNVIQLNPAMYGANTMQFQGIFDIGDPLYVYGGLALDAGASGMNVSSLNAVTNAWSYAFALEFVGKTPAQYNNVRVVDQTNNAFISVVFGLPTYTKLQMQGPANNELTAAAYVVLPVDLLSFSGYKDGTRNELRWKTASELNNKGFEVQRSLDGVNYSTISFVNSLAPGGYSSTQLNYAYSDINVTGTKQFYRLRQIDFDGRSKISNIVLLKSEKPLVITIDGMFPNPATTTLNMMLSSPVKDKVTLTVTDLSGKHVIMRSLNVEMGSNTLPVNVSSLAGGTYIVRMISSTGDVSTGKFVKQ